MCCHSVIREVIHHPELFIEEMPDVRIKPVHEGKAMIFPSIVLQEKKERNKYTRDVKSLWFFQQLNTFLLSVSSFALLQRIFHFESFVGITCSILPGLLLHESHHNCPSLVGYHHPMWEKSPSLFWSAGAIFHCSAALTSAILNKIDLQNLEIYSSRGF